MKRWFRFVLAKMQIVRYDTKSSSTCNELLPGSLSMHFRHSRFQTMQLQHISLRFINELSGTGPGAIARILRMGYRGRALGFARLAIRARQRSARQARLLLREVEQAIVAAGVAANRRPPCGTAWVG